AQTRWPYGRGGSAGLGARGVREGGPFAGEGEGRGLDTGGGAALYHAATGPGHAGGILDVSAKGRSRQGATWASDPNPFRSAIPVPLDQQCVAGGQRPLF